MEINLSIALNVNGWISTRPSWIPYHMTLLQERRTSPIYVYNQEEDGWGIFVMTVTSDDFEHYFLPDKLVLLE